VIGSPRCAFCGEEVYTRSGWRVGQNWFCSQSCFQKYEAWRSGRSKFAPRPLPAAPPGTRRSPERPKGGGLRRPRLPTVLIGGAILGSLAVLLLMKPSLHSGKSLDKAANAANGALALPRQTPRLDSAWLLKAINSQRRRTGHQPLSADRAASLLAQQQSARMADAGRLHAISNRDLRPFSYAGTVEEHEFQEEGGSLPQTSAEVFADMMRGKGLRRDSLSGRFNRVGIGVTRRPPSLWVTLIFIRA
jgi:Cysteine-rich secretory protein family